MSIDKSLICFYFCFVSSQCFSGCTFLLDDISPPMSLAGGMAGEMAGAVAGEMGGDLAGETAGEDNLLLIDDGYQCSGALYCEHRAGSIDRSCATLEPITQTVAACQGSMCIKDLNITIPTAGISVPNVLNPYSWLEDVFKNGEPFPQAELFTGLALNTSMDDFNYLPLLKEDGTGLYQHQFVPNLCNNFINIDQFMVGAVETLQLPMMDSTISGNGYENLIVYIAVCGSAVGKLIFEIDVIKELIISSNTVNVEFSGTRIISGLSSIVASDIEFSNVLIEDTDRITIAKSKVKISNDQGSMLLPPSDINITSSTLITDSTLEIGNEDEESTIVIRDSTIVMTNPNQPLFKFSNANVEFYNVLLITSGQAIQLEGSAFTSNNFFLISSDVGTSEETPAIHVDGASQFTVEGSYWSTTNPANILIEQGGRFLLKYADIKNSGSFLKAIVSGEQVAENEEALLQLKHIRYEGAQFVELITQGTQEIPNPHEIFGDREAREALIDADGQVILPVSRVLGLSNCDLTLNGGDSTPLISLRGGGQAVVERCHLNGDVNIVNSQGDESSLSMGSPWLYILNSYLEGNINLSSGFTLIDHSIVAGEEFHVQGEAQAWISYVKSSDTPQHLLIDGKVLSTSSKLSGMIEQTPESLLIFQQSELTQTESDETALLVNNASLKVIGSQISSQGSVLLASNSPEIEVMDSALKGLSESATRPLITTDGSWSLERSLVIGKSDQAPLLFQIAETLTLDHTVLAGEASYGVYLSSGTHLSHDSSVIDLQSEFAVDLYLEAYVQLTPGEFTLQTTGVSIVHPLSDPDLFKKTFSCHGALYQGECPRLLDEQGTIQACYEQVAEVSQAQ